MKSIEFADKLSAINISDTTKRDLAIFFQVSDDTVDRWISGTATPHPTLQDQIIARAIITFPTQNELHDPWK